MRGSNGMFFFCCFPFFFRWSKCFHFSVNVFYIVGFLKRSEALKKESPQTLICCTDFFEVVIDRQRKYAH